MRIQTLILLSASLAGSTSMASAKDVFDCAKKSLADLVEKAKPGDTISFTGACAGPVVLRTGNLTLDGEGSAVVDGRGQDAIVIEGAHGIKLSDFEVRGGRNGILVQNGGSVSVDTVTSRQNGLSGISLQTGASANIKDSVARDNGLHGLDLETGSSALVTGTFSAASNRVFGINANGSSLTFSRASVTVTGNVLGIQVATAANAFLNDSATVLDITGNIATGLTVVSGAHMVSFGGRINANGNGAFGVSVNSKGGLDLDAGSVLTASNNRAGGLALQQQSVMTAFNNPQFSGAPGFSSINTLGNTVSGISVLTGSTLTLANQAQIVSTGNGVFGLLVDNGSGVTLRNTTLTGNTVRDLQMAFGARVDVQVALTVGTSSCDATVLIRGAGFSCPK